jgi:hypothetical protein
MSAHLVPRVFITHLLAKKTTLIRSKKRRKMSKYHCLTYNILRPVQGSYLGFTLSVTSQSVNNDKT